MKIKIWSMRFVLTICALHSIGVFLGLVILSAAQITWFGFPNSECVFFQKQAGVFHLVMSILYFMAIRQSALIPFIVIAKSIAVLFLIVSFFWIATSWMIVFSACVDAAFAVSIYILYKQE
jgi:hypothetical protein